MYGWRARLGLIVPSSTTIEPEYRAALPAGVSLHVSRMWLDDVATAATLRDMVDDAEACGALLDTADVDVLAFACTVGSLLDGPGTAEEIERRLTAETGRPAVATAAAVDRALDALDVGSVAVTTPYTDELDDLERDYLEALGYDVVAIEGLGLERDTEMGRLSPSTAYGEAQAVDTEDADCVFISCTNYRTFDVVGRLERDLGKPVVTSNQATLWNALARAGVDPSIPDLGELFALSP